MLRVVGNVLWFLLAGIWLALGYVITGLLLCVTIIGIPFGIQAWKLAVFTLWPFGKSVVRAPDEGCLTIGFNVLWVVFFGWGLFIGHLVAGFLLCLTIIGIPFGIQAWKLSVIALWPFGRAISDFDKPGNVVYAVPADPTRR